MAKRGAPLGNTNALKHGFYSRKFRSLELADLDALQVGLASEVAMLRVVTRRLFDYFSLVEEKGGQGKDACLKDLTSAMLALGVLATRISGLLRANQVLTGADNPIDGPLQIALQEFIQETKLSL
jgi:hypothetical protein